MALAMFEPVEWAPPIPPDDLLEIETFLRSQGIHPAKVDPEQYYRKIPVFEEARQEARTLILPRALFILIPVRQIVDGQIILHGEEVIESRLLGSLLKTASEILVGVSTVGEALEKRVEEHFRQGNSAKAVALDGWGTTALAGFAQRFEEHCSSVAQSRRKNLSIIFEPGHAEWPLEQQQVLFRLLPAQKIGVRLTTSSLMIPKKSVSRLAGLGDTPFAEGTKCNYCSRREQCLFRRSSSGDFSSRHV